MSSHGAPRGGSAALVIAHPGHELRIHGWLEQVRPSVFVLTDGSGHGDRPRIDGTTEVLANAGAIRGSIYGRLSDKAFYAAAIDGRHQVFTGLVDELIEAFLDPNLAYVVGDSIQGYNPAHDVCRLLVQAAMTVANRLRPKRLGNYAFPPVGPPVPADGVDADGRVLLELDDAAFDRKLSRAAAYQGLGDEVAAAVAEIGREALRRECLWPAGDHLALPDGPGTKPFYEEYGERQVEAGHYPRVLRLREHMQPLAEALRAHVVVPRSAVCGS